MEPSGLNHDDRSYLIEAIYRIVNQVEKRFDALRATDREAVTLAHEDLSKRLSGFPQQYATKVEMESAADLLKRLELIALPRAIYDQNHASIVDMITKLDREKLNVGVFNTFVDNYRIAMDNATAERRTVAEVLANATEQVRRQVLEERAEFITQEAYDQRHQALVQQVDAVERWQYKLVGALVFATFVAPAVTAVIVYVLTRGTLMAPFVVAVFLVVSGLFFTYIAVGLAKAQERKRGFIECEQRLEILRRQIRRMSRL